MANPERLESIVALFHKLLAHQDDVKIQVRDRLPDKDTGELREVDVSIRGKVASAPVLIIVECRDHARTQDVQWIEQLETKRVGVGANAAIAVSSSGFSLSLIHI